MRDGQWPEEIEEERDYQEGLRGFRLECVGLIEISDWLYRLE